MKRILTTLLSISMLLSLVVPAYARDTRYTNINQLTDEDYLEEDFFHTYLKDYGHLFGGPDGNFPVVGNQVDPFPQDLQVLMPSGSRCPYYYPPANSERIELPSSLVILFGDFNKSSFRYYNLHEINWEDLTELRYIAGNFNSTPLFSVDLSKTKVVRIGGEGGSFAYNPFLAEFVASPVLRRIDDGAFYGCTDMIYLGLNEGLEYIGANNFGYNFTGESLENPAVKLKIPSTVKYIGKGGLPTVVNYKDRKTGETRKVKAKYTVYKDTYGEQWCKDNGLEYTYARDKNGNVAVRPFDPNEKAPALKDPVQIGDLLFTNVVDFEENKSPVYDHQFNLVGEKVQSYHVKLTPNALVQTTKNGVDLVQSYGHNSGLNSKSPEQLLRLDSIRPFLTPVSGKGYQSGLTWKIERDENCPAGQYYNSYKFYIQNASGNFDYNDTYYYIEVRDKWAESEVQKPEPPVKPEIPVAPKTIQVTPNKSTVLVGGKPVNFEAYTIEGHNCFMLRDIAKALNGTPVQFSVDWDQKDKLVSIGVAKAYKPVGGELKAGDGKPKTAIVHDSYRLMTDMWGVVDAAAYTIHNNNFFQLREIGDICGFAVDWDQKTKTVIIDTSKNLYEEAFS